MLINVSPNADVSVLRRKLGGLGLWVKPLVNSDGMVQSILVKSNSTPVALRDIRNLPGVVNVLEHPSPHPLVDENSGVEHAARMLGLTLNVPNLVAGPCSIEDEATIETIAAAVAKAGGAVLRGGAFKPRTSPYSFSGHGQPALQWMRASADRHGLKVVTEVMSEYEVETVSHYADVLQVGSRNMQNFALLNRVGAANMPVLLKRGRAATVEEWLMAGEHLYAGGASLVVFCERGVRGFDDSVRNLLDLSAVALLSHHYDLPVIVDPSHASGRRDLVIPLAQAAVAAGAMAVMVEVHPQPDNALSDAPQALGLEALTTLAQSMGLNGDK